MGYARSRAAQVPSFKGFKTDLRRLDYIIRPGATENSILVYDENEQTPLATIVLRELADQ